MALTKDRLVFDPADLPTSDQVGSYLIGAGGLVITSTTDGGNEALDVNMINDIGVAIDGFYDVSTNANPDDIGLILNTRSASPDETTQVERTTAGAASSDAVVAANVHGADVNAFGMGYNGTTWDRLKVDTVNGGMLVFPQGIVGDDEPSTGSEISILIGGVGEGSALGPLSASGDKFDVTGDLYRRPYINDSCAVDSKASAETVGVAAVELASTALGGRKKVMIQSLDKDIYLGHDNSVTTSNGLRIAKGATFEMDLGEYIELWAISASAGNDVRIFEAG